jgi:hypothetical protein
MSKRRKFTPWIDGNIKPERHGVYQRNYADGADLPEVDFARWNGKYWFWRAATISGALMKRVMSGNQSLPWRGLASDPRQRNDRHL